MNKLMTSQSSEYNANQNLLLAVCRLVNKEKKKLVVKTVTQVTEAIVRRFTCWGIAMHFSVALVVFF